MVPQRSEIAIVSGEEIRKCLFRRADLVVWDAEQVEDIIATLAPRRLVVKRGRITIEHERSVRDRWRGLS